MSKKQEVTIKFFRQFDKWRFFIEFGKYRVGGMAENLSDAEKKAEFALSGLPEYGIINRVYEGG